jgi:hypothetical protein
VKSVGRRSWLRAGCSAGAGRPAFPARQARPGRVLVDLAVMLPDGREAIAGIGGWG